ncbi:hypothetical protein [Herpetosiphon sp.]|uniref:Uncharacterized protein n=1 Tax=Herpetosiphon aurantiacus (strain ATCC 23779 / DSM 785 / 114-95) TaxID=316274 RepID=A9AWR4_HERA2|nr:hypothetical protein [Herpetosiphon sp.]ABX03315.1 hypothetical protein Haur_0667 [Herpetosiphon aurantiacus DSM 785]
MADELANERYASESIPDKDFLYMRVHKSFIQNGNPGYGAFKPQGDGLSTDWDNYSTPQETRARATSTKDLPINLYAVVKMSVALVRAITELTVVHTPINKDEENGPNQAHTDIKGIDMANRVQANVLRRKLSEIAPIVLDVGQE